MITGSLLLKFGALADFKTILEKAKRQTVSELSHKTPVSLGAKLLTASTASRAFRNRHLGTLMRCCEACEPVGKGNALIRSLSNALTSTGSAWSL